MVTHSGEKHFRCDVCDYSANQKGHPTKHKHHTRERILTTALSATIKRGREEIFTVMNM